MLPGRLFGRLSVRPAVVRRLSSIACLLPILRDAISLFSIGITKKLTTDIHHGVGIAINVFKVRGQRPGP